MNSIKGHVELSLKFWGLEGLVLCLALLVSPSASAFWAAATPLSLHVLEDPLGQESIETVSSSSRRQDFKPVPGSFAGGYTRSVYWFRVEVKAPDFEAKFLPNRLLEVRPTYLDDVRFYLQDPANPGYFIEHRHGDRLAFSQRVLSTRTLVQPVVFINASPQTVYVRLQTTSSAVFSLQAWRPVDFLVATSAEYALLGILLGGMFLRCWPICLVFGADRMRWRLISWFT